MQESKGERIVICTINDMTNLPPEFMRRFDVSWFVDFPNLSERKEIVQIMNQRYGSKLPIDDKFLVQIKGFTGAEIELLAKDSLFDDLETAIENIPLLKNIKAKEIEELRKTYINQMRRANKPEVIVENNSPKRKISNDSMIDDKFKMSIKEKLALRKKEK